MSVTTPETLVEKAEWVLFTKAGDVESYIAIGNSELNG